MPIPKTASARSKQELIYTVWHLLAFIDTLSFQIRSSTLGPGLEPSNPENKDSPALTRYLKIGKSLGNSSGTQLQYHSPQQQSALFYDEKHRTSSIELLETHET